MFFKTMEISQLQYEPQSPCEGSIPVRCTPANHHGSTVHSIIIVLVGVMAGTGPSIQVGLCKPRSAKDTIYGG